MVIAGTSIIIAGRSTIFVLLFVDSGFLKNNGEL